jgi:putative DNA primase/helicase
MSTGPYATAALEYVQAGWAGPLPLPPKAKNWPPTGFTGKEGRFPTEGEIRRWQVEHHDGNIALRPDHDVIGLDLDVYKNFDARSNLERYLGCELPETWCSTSRDDGSGIFWYRVQPPPEGRRWNTAPVTGVEVVQFGHRYGVAPPSIHPASGQPYVWRNGKEQTRIPHTTELAELPLQAQQALLGPLPHFNAREAVEFELTEGEPSARVLQQLASAIEDCNAVGGARHDLVRDRVAALVRLSEKGEPGVKGALADLQVEFVSTVGPDRKGGEREADKEFERLVKGAHQLVRTTERDATPNVGLDGRGLNDVGNADRLIALHGQRLRFVRQWGSWIVYRSGRWIVDSNDVLITEMAKDVPHELARMAGASGKLDTDQGVRSYKWALRSLNGGPIATMVRLARGIPGVTVEHEDLDPDPLLLNCANGTVDLRSGHLLPHNPADLCTLQTPVDYDPKARSPLWEACLLQWLPDPQVREYVQREVGAGATGRPTETLSIHYGQGANGKSRFFGAVVEALGEYATQLHKSLLTRSKHEQHPTVVASLFRRRFAVASETAGAAHLNEEDVKNLTGGDRVRARRMREDEWSFDPTHTLVLFTNHQPRIVGRDEGIWRRVRLVPWNVGIPKTQRDEALADKLRAELPGILAWIVQGAQRFLKQGIGAPTQIEAATEQYRGDQDTVARFLHDEGVTVDSASSNRTKAPTLVAAHRDWCEANGHRHESHYQLVTKRLVELGAVSKQARVGQWRGLVWRGVSVEKPQ